ncbi:hypothetical protein OPIT5_03960 [Opitutaceae bacterium TAV5]|nr:hypothetical protein OPIT5_03960 [Opitutaceae bacterium TAV5]
MSFSSTTPIAKTRRVHRCRWCGKRIEIGSAAVSVAGKWEGDFFHDYQHPECWRAENQYVRDEGGCEVELPDEAQPRGATTDQYGDEITDRWSDAPVSKREVLFPDEFIKRMKIEKKDTTNG